MKFLFSLPLARFQSPPRAFWVSCRIVVRAGRELLCSLVGFCLAVNFAYAQCTQVQDRTGSLTGTIPPWTASLFYNSISRQVIAFNSQLDGNGPLLEGYDGLSWSTINWFATGENKPPFPYEGFGFAYDSVRGVALLYGGGHHLSGFDLTNSLYSLDSSYTFHRLTWTGPSPPAASAVLATFDPNRGRAIFLIPGSSSYHYETWEWTGFAWEQGPTLGPVASDSFTFDASRNIGFLAGHKSDSTFEDVWFYHPGASAAQGTWEQQTVTGPPYDGVGGAQLVYDPLRHRVLRCFGRYISNNNGYTSQVEPWDYVASTWIRTDYDDDLPFSERRAVAAVAFDPNRDVMVITGGARVDSDGTFVSYQDTWVEKFSGPTLLSSSQETSVHCEGEMAVFSLTAGGDNLTYEWFHNAVLIPNANTALLVVNNLTAADSGNYVGRAKNDCGYVDTPIIRLQVKGPITIHRPAIFPDCSSTCAGSDVSIFPPNPLDLSLNMHLQKWMGAWVDVRVSTPSAPTNFVFQNVQTNFTGNYRFYIDGSPCDPYVDSEHWIQVGFDISKQPLSLSNVRPCSYPTFAVGWTGACGIPEYHWFKDDFQFLSEDDGHFRGVHTDTLRIEGARYEDEGSYGCMLVDTNQCNYTNISQLATLRLVPAQWVLRSLSGPPARYGHAMVYDSTRGVTVLFGGARLSEDHSHYEDFGEVWEWNGANWRQRTTASPSSGWVYQTNTGYWFPTAYDVPVPRHEHAMAYDSKRGRVVLFGGRSQFPSNFDTFLSDTWEWDGLAWQLRATNGPVARMDHAMAYDAARGVTVLFGGYSPSESGLVWEWDGNSWKSNAPSVGPASNYSQVTGSMAYDSWRHKIVYGPTTDGFFPNKFWTWNGSDWSFQGSGFGDVIPSPPYGVMVFDSFRARPLYFGGEQNRFGSSLTASFFESSSATLRAQWSLQPDAASISQFVTNDFIAPSIVIQIRQRTDPLSDFLWNQLSDATHQTLTNESSTPGQQISALGAYFNRILSGPSLYDPQRFAGITLSAETLAFQSLNPWWERDPNLLRLNRLLLEDYYSSAIARSPSMPPGRMQHAMAYDSRRHATVLFGGLYDPINPPQLAGNETWELLAFDKPIIIEQPPSQYRTPGESISFHVDARAPAGDLLTYQWFFGEQALSDSAHVQGSNKDTLTLLNITLADAGQYRVRASDDCGFSDSFPAILTLDPKLQLFSIVNALKLIWTDANVTLEQADAAAGPWSAVPGAASPFDIALAGPGKFFRLRPTAL